MKNKGRPEPVTFVTILVQLQPGYLRSLRVKDRTVGCTLFSRGQLLRHSFTFDINEIDLRDTVVVASSSMDEVR